MEFLTNHRLETDGIEAYVENGKIIERDDQNEFTFEDTKENRKEVINDIKNTIKEWNNKY